MLTLIKILHVARSDKRQYYLISERLFRKCSITFYESDVKLSENPKIVVTKKKFSANRREEILEWRSAGSVIKKFNTECKYLYGPVQSSGPQVKIFEENDIIQNKTPIPITESAISNDSTLKESTRDNTQNLKKILTFPLENKVIQSKRVQELNYLKNHLEVLSNASVPSVSLILQKTMPEERIKILDRWKQNMVKELGVEGFEKYQKALLENGSYLHNNISTFLSSTPEFELDVREENIGHWKSLKKVLPNITQVKLLEEFVTHPFLRYRGVVDCFAKYRDILVVIDWKTSKKPKTNVKDLYDNPLQLAAYVGALNFDPKFQYLALKGIVVVAYESGEPATVHYFNETSMRLYWSEWLKRVKQYWEMKCLESENLS